MITVLETTSFPDGKQEKHSKQYESRAQYYKVLKRSSLDGKLIYMLKKKSKFTINYDEGISTTIEVIDDKEAQRSDLLTGV